ncbi:hypothetical protein [Ruegeria jejuensis]|uniref:hypothetical protein n=1 Tax=Ruegeria jejuensis TaxID=3233338 RepID=UPI00355BAD35
MTGLDQPVATALPRDRMAAVSPNLFLDLLRCTRTRRENYCLSEKVPAATRLQKLPLMHGAAVISVARIKMRTLPPLPFRVFAYAAFARKCGPLFAALQPVSAERPLKSTSRDEIQTALSPREGSTIEERTRTKPLL